MGQASGLRGAIWTSHGGRAIVWSFPCKSPRQKITAAPNGGTWLLQTSAAALHGQKSIIPLQSQGCCAMAYRQQKRPPPKQQLREAARGEKSPSDYTSWRR
nr:MAG TPA: hypothetical protein [Caudoviricetes sp.]